MTDVETASEVLTTLNNSHPSIDFTMMLEENGRLPFLAMEVIYKHKGVPNNQRTVGSCYTITARWIGDINAH